MVAALYAASRHPGPEAVSRSPILFQLARYLIRLGVPGGWRLWSRLYEKGALDIVVEYPLRGAVRSAPLRVPLYRKESSWSEPEIASYSRNIVQRTLRRVAQFGIPAVLIDCGADIGMVTSSFIRDCAQLIEVIAYEPNNNAFRFLAASATGWTMPSRIVNAAVSDHAGRGRLAAPKGEADEHAMFLIDDPDGPIEVRKVDSEAVPKDSLLVLKIDVEGAELDVVRGAAESLRKAPAFVVILEAHPKVAARTGIDPCEAMRFLGAICPIDIEIVELPDVMIDPALPFFDQLGGRRDTICNVICASKPTQGVVAA